MCLHVHAHHQPVAQRADVTVQSLAQELPRTDGPAGDDAGRAVRPPLQPVPDDARAA